MPPGAGASGDPGLGPSARRPRGDDRGADLEGRPEGDRSECDDPAVHRGGSPEARPLIAPWVDGRIDGPMTAPVHVYVEDLKKHVGQDVTIKGWLYNRRAKGKISFLILRDGTGLVQAVAVKAEIG